MDNVLFGFWHQKLGSEPKLVAYGYGNGQISEALAAFKSAFPKKSQDNLTLTLDRTEAEYIEIMQEQEARKKSKVRV